MEDRIKSLEFMINSEFESVYTIEEMKKDIEILTECLEHKYKLSSIESEYKKLDYDKRDLEFKTNELTLEL